MKHILFTLLISCTGHFARSQGFLVTSDRPFIADRGKDTSVLGPISRANAWKHLNSSEKDYLYWVNWMRIDPPGFFKTYVKAYLVQFPEAVSEESKSLGSDMASIASLPMMFPTKNLNLAAASHASNLVTRGEISHTGKDGLSFSQRMEEAGVRDCAGEVIFQGKEDALLSLILLLIDHNVPGTGHRKALLNASFTRTGVGVRTSADKRAVFVQDLSCN